MGKYKRKEVYLSKAILMQCGINKENRDVALKELLKKGLIKYINGKVQMLSPTEFERACQYVRDNADRINEVTEDDEDDETDLIIEPQTMTFSMTMKKDLGLLNGTMLEIERLLSFKIGSVDAREHLMKLVQGLMVTSIGVGINSVHDKIDRIVVDNITNSFGTRGS